MACKPKAYKSGFTPERLEALEGAIAEGVLEVWYNDKKIRYTTLTEMMRVRAIMRRALGLSGKGGSGLFGGERRVMRPSKGLETSSDFEGESEEQGDLSLYE